MKNRTFFYVELSEEALHYVRSSCKVLEQLICGNLDYVQNAVMDAYIMRECKEVPAEVKQQIKDCIKGLESLGWNKPLESCQRFNKDSDTYRDIYEVLDHQMAILGKDNKSEGVPPHYNKEVPQIRVIDVVESSQNRNKPLKVFVDVKTRRRRI